MKPGKPLIHGRIGPIRVIGLPGNPVSSFVCAELFLRPLIRALCGDLQAGADRTEPAIAGAALRPGGARREYIRATLSRDAEGRAIVTPQPEQDSSLTSVLAGSQALILREARTPPCAKGETVRILRLTD
jgi:molybdopterin molybdotransferase